MIKNNYGIYLPSIFIAYVFKVLLKILLKIAVSTEEINNNMNRHPVFDNEFLLK